MISQFKAMPQSQKESLAKQVGANIPSDQVSTSSSIGETTTLDQAEVDITPENQIDPLSQVYGKSFFSRNKSNYTVTDNALVPADYMLGAGDELIIQLFGKVNETYTLQVSREGIINFPKVGPISVLGLSYLDAQRIIKSKINQDFIGVDSMISMGRLRSINIFVTGEVNVPGAYSVSALSTITQALYRSGGINSIGSVRNIEVKRAGKVVNQFDLYDLLTKGDNSKDIRMQNADVLHVPSYDAIVKLTG